MARSKAGNKRAAKKAARTRKKNEGSRRASLAKAAGTASEEAFVRHYHLKKKYTVRGGAGIPDYINLGKRGWEFLEVKPAKGAKRLLHESQLKMFPELIKKGERVYIFYYTRKNKGSKAKPKYSFTFQKILLKMKHFKNREGPNPDYLLD